MSDRHAERGQTLPLWTLTIAATLTVLFFLTNYANVVGWGIRAQNAADAAASAAIATDANMYNQSSTLVYAATVDETRMRYLLQAILNTINDPASCGSSCDADYTKLVSAYQTAASNYASLTQAMQKGDNLSEGGLKNAPDKAVGMMSGNCTLFDCAFTYTSTVNGTAETADVIACKNVPYLAPSLFGLGSSASFTALGRSVATLSAVPETFVPGAINPSTGVPYQPDESPAGSNVSSDFVVTYGTLDVNLTWYVAGTMHPATTASGYGCS